jgi:electron transfer flavoprotein beta subunit
MKILVCMKAVPSTSQVQVDGEYILQRNNATLEWNVADQSALEAALQSKGPGDIVTVLTMGPAKLAENMRELFARGVSRAILVTDPAFAGADTYATVITLTRAIQSLGNYDLILCGRRSMDGETGQVPSMLACSLGIPCVTNVEHFKLTGRTIEADRRLDNASQKWTLELPCMLSICEYTYPLRLPSIMGMRKAKDKVIKTMDISELQLSPKRCGLNGSLTRVITMEHKFPGLRKGPKTDDIPSGIDTILSFVQEVSE